MKTEERTLPFEYFNKAAIFAKVAETGSFSAAARELGLARSTVSAHVRELEEVFDLRLLERTTRKLRLTEEGELMVARLQSVLEEWESVHELFQERSQRVMGELRVTAPSALARPLLAPVIGEMLRLHPEVSVRLELKDEVQDLLEEKIDVAIRLAPLPPSSLIARKLADIPTFLVAAPGVMTLCSEDPEVLSELDWVEHSRVRRRQVRLTHEKTGEQREISVRCRVQSSTTEGLLALLEEGVGVSILPEIIAEEALKHGRIERVFSQWTVGSIPLFAVFPSRPHMTSRLRVFLELLVTRMEGN